MDVSQWAIDLNLASADRDRLEGLIRSGNTPQKLVPRARIALLSDGDLQAAIHRFIAEHNKTAKRFVWTADPDRIIASINKAKRKPPVFAAYHRVG